MSFDSKKNEYGAAISHGVSIFVNACKYTVNGAFDKRNITTSSSIAQGYTGNLSISGGDALFFSNADPYLAINGEKIKISIVDANTINILSRGAFGTTDAAHTAGEAMIVHSGEADGSCLGYPKRPDGGGCSTPNSFDRDAEREFLFIDTQSFDGQIYYNGLTSISHNPCLLKPAKAMAKSASASVSITDNTDDDVYSVPYPERRTSKSTLVKKLIARTGGYLQNRRAITYTGFQSNGNFSKSDCIAREYIIDSATLNNGRFDLKLLDPLMLAEESKTKIPTVSSGKLLNAITDASTTIELKDFVVDEYGTNGTQVTVKIDDELINCTVTDSATGSLAIVDRQVDGSTKKDHSINASVQYVIVLANYNPISEIVRALQTTNIPARFYDDYTTAINNVQNATGPVYIFKPDSVAKYVSTIIETWAESNIALYFDERAQLIKIKTNSEFEQQPVTLDYSVDIKEQSLKVTPSYDKQFTRSSIGFAPFNAAKKTNDENSSILFESINILTELTGTLEPQSEPTFYTQFLSNSDTDVQIAVGGTARKANINTKVPETFVFDIDYSNYGVVGSGVIEEGEIISITTDETIDDYGNPKANNVQIVSLKDNPSKATYTLTAVTYQDIINQNDFDFIVDTDKENYDLSTEFAPTTAGEYTVFITSGTTIGGTSTTLKAFTTGSQAAGVSLKIIIRGGILGAGGDGADANDLLMFNPLDPRRTEIEKGSGGLNGGDALDLTCDCIIDVSQGVIFSGGGGAPSTDSVASTFGDYIAIGGNGGSGGQGYIGGSGGGFATTSIIDFINGDVVDSGQNGVDGTRAAAGELAGLSGGSFGESSDYNANSGGAGLAGYAIRANGNNVTIIGDNNLTIKGLRDF